MRHIQIVQNEQCPHPNEIATWSTEAAPRPACVARDGIIGVAIARGAQSA